VTDQSRAVLADALKLTAADRAEVAAELLRSLDEDEATLPREDVERLWNEEITRRAHRAIRGESVGRDAEEVFASVRAKLRG
jgi:putative addiction module component